MALTFESTAGDNDVVLEISLTDAEGNLQPVLGNEVVSFIASDWRGTVVLTLTGTISSVPESKAAAVAMSADTATLKGRVLRVKVPVTFTSGAVETWPTDKDDYLWAIY